MTLPFRMSVSNPGLLGSSAKRLKAAIRKHKTLRSQGRQVGGGDSLDHATVNLLSLEWRSGGLVLQVRNDSGCFYRCVHTVMQRGITH